MTKGYQTPFSALHPLVLIIYFPTVLLLSVFSSHPLIPAVAYLSGSMYLLISTYLRGKSVAKTFFSSLSSALALVILSALINPLFSHNGDTVLFFLNDNAITLESFWRGAHLGIAISSAAVWCMCLSDSLSSEGVLYLVGKASPKLALVLSIALRYIPLMKLRFSKIHRAQIAAGGYNEATLVGRVYCKLHCFSILVTWALESGIGTGDSMRARGFGLKGRTCYSSFKFRRGDAILLSLIMATSFVATVFMLLGGGDFEFFPTLTPIFNSRFSLPTHISFACLCLIPTAYTVKEVLVWKNCMSRI